MLRATGRCWESHSHRGQVSRSVRPAEPLSRQILLPVRALVDAEQGLAARGRDSSSRRSDRGGVAGYGATPHGSWKPNWEPYLAANDHSHPDTPSRTAPRNTWPGDTSSPPGTIQLPYEIDWPSNRSIGSPWQVLPTHDIGGTAAVGQIVVVTGNLAPKANGVYALRRAAGAAVRVCRARAAGFRRWQDARAGR